MTYHHPLTTTLTHVQLNISTGEKKKKENHTPNLIHN